MMFGFPRRIFVPCSPLLFIQEESLDRKRDISRVLSCSNEKSRTLSTIRSNGVLSDHKCLFYDVESMGMRNPDVCGSKFFLSTERKNKKKKGKTGSTCLVWRAALQRHFAQKKRPSRSEDPLSFSRARHVAIFPYPHFNLFFICNENNYSSLLILTKS